MRLALILWSPKLCDIATGTTPKLAARGVGYFASRPSLTILAGLAGLLEGKSSRPDDPRNCCWQ